jgi:hypothetical protein
MAVLPRLRRFFAWLLLFASNVLTRTNYSLGCHAGFDVARVLEGQLGAFLAGSFCSYVEMEAAAPVTFRQHDRRPSLHHSRSRGRVRSRREFARTGSERCAHLPRGLGTPVGNACGRFGYQQHPHNRGRDSVGIPFDRQTDRQGDDEPQKSANNSDVKSPGKRWFTGFSGGCQLGWA